MIAHSKAEINKKILQLAIPMGGTQFIAMGSIFVCMSMLASLGHDVLAASALMFSISLGVIVIGFSLLLALCVLVGHAYGAEDYIGVGSLFQQSWLLGLLLCIPVLLIFWYIYPILIAFGQNPAIAKLVEEYMHASIWRVPPIFLAVCNQQLCYGVHKQKIDVWANMLGAVLVMACSYVLIFGWMGIPAFGVAGLGYAMAIQGWFYFIFTVICFIYIPDFKKFKLFDIRLHHHWDMLFRLCRVGWPIGIQISAEMISFLVCSVFVGWLGVDALAAMQVILQYQFLFIVPIFSLSQAGSVLVGQAYGAKQFADIKPIGWAGFRIAVVVSLVSGFIFVFSPHWLASFYLNVHDPVNKSVVDLIAVLFCVLALSQFFDAMRHILTGVLRGLFDTKYPMYVGLFCIWVVGLPLSYLLAFYWHFGVVGVMLGGAVGCLVGFGMLLYRWVLVRV